MKKGEKKGERERTYVVRRGYNLRILRVYARLVDTYVNCEYPYYRRENFTCASGFRVCFDFVPVRHVLLPVHFFARIARIPLFYNVKS